MRWVSLTCLTVLHTETSSLHWELTVASHHFERLENLDSRCFYSFDGGEPFLWRRHEALCTAPQSPVEGLSDLWFHPSFTAPGDETESDMTSFFSRSSHRDKPFMFPSPSTTVSVSPSHCQQLHLPHLSFLDLPLFTDSTLGAHWLGWTG